MELGCRVPCGLGVMEKRRMNLPTGPDTLCFDKDEFMKVREPGRSAAELARR